MSRLAIALALLLAAIAAAPWDAGVVTAQPFEYRLKVVNLHEDAILSSLRRAETGDGATGSGIDALEARLDAGTFPRSPQLYDRHLRTASPETARAWGAAPLRTEVKLGGGRGDPWDEVRWDGTPGGHSVWLVAASHRSPQEVRRLVLRGGGRSRHVQPYAPAMGGRPLTALSTSLAFVRSRERDDSVWAHLSPRVDLGEGIAAVVMIDDDVLWPDRVYLVVRHLERPAEYRAILGWKTRENDRESPSYQ